MKTSSTASPKQQQPKSILLIGPPGGGKTTLMLQFPGLVVHDCDLNLDGPEQFLRKKLKLDLNYMWETITLNSETGKPRPVEQCFDYILDQLVLLANDPPAGFQTYGLDSLLLVNEFIVQRVLKQQGNKTTMEPHYWGPFKTALISLLVGKLRSLGVTTIVTCHEVILTKPSSDPKKMMQEELIGYRPAVQGGITDFLGGFFTDMWRLEARPAPGGTQEIVMTTCRTTTSELKNSMLLPAQIINPTYAMLEPYLKGTI